MFRLITLLSIISLGFSQIVVNGNNQELVNQKIAELHRRLSSPEYKTKLRRLKNVLNVLNFKPDLKPKYTTQSPETINDSLDSIYQDFYVSNNKDKNSDLDFYTEYVNNDNSIYEDFYIQKEDNDDYKYKFDQCFDDLKLLSDRITKYEQIFKNIEVEIVTLNNIIKQNKITNLKTKLRH